MAYTQVTWLFAVATALSVTATVLVLMGSWAQAKSLSYPGSAKLLLAKRLSPVGVPLGILAMLLMILAGVAEGRNIQVLICFGALLLSSLVASMICCALLPAKNHFIAIAVTSASATGAIGALALDMRSLLLGGIAVLLSVWCTVSEHQRLHYKALAN